MQDKAWEEFWQSVLEIAVSFPAVLVLFFIISSLLSTTVSGKIRKPLIMGTTAAIFGMSISLMFALFDSITPTLAVLLSLAASLGWVGGFQMKVLGKLDEDNFEFAFARRISFQSKRSISGLLVVLAILSIGLGVAVMEVSMSILYGFKREIQNKVVGFGSHIQIGNYLAELESSLTPLPKRNDFVAVIDSMPEVTSIAPYVFLPGMLKSKETLEGIILKGVDLRFDWEFFKSNLSRGEIPDYDTERESREILISEKLANLLLLDTNSRALIYFFDDKPRVRPVRIAGIYETGLEEFDAVNVICDLRVLQRILRWNPNQVSGFEVNLKDVSELVVMEDKIREVLPVKFEPYPITEIYPEIFDWLELQNQNVWAIILLMVIIAVINMISVTLILIIEKTRTIGLLKALGLTNYRIRKVFIFNAMVLIMIGVFCGNALGLLLNLSQQELGWLTVNQENYFVKTVPVSWPWESFFLINLGIVLVCSLFMLLPTLAITRISAVSAMRFD